MNDKKAEKERVKKAAAEAEARAQEAKELAKKHEKEAKERAKQQEKDAKEHTKQLAKDSKAAAEKAKHDAKLKEKSDDELVRLANLKHQKPRRKLQRRSLQEYLDKAGFDANADRVKKITLRIVIMTFIVLTAVVFVLAEHANTRASDVIIFIIAMWVVLFGAALLAAWAGIYFFLDYRIYKRTRELEDVLPDFLQLASSNISAGMPIDRALWYAIRPNFGVLAKEMEDVAKSTMAGEDLEVGLVRFANRYDSTMLKRSVNILIEGLHAGGEMADLLNKIAVNIDEMKIMKKEMAASVTTYAIFITFASMIIAPFLFALATELLTIIIKITGSLNLSSSSVLSLASPDPSAISNFKIFSVFMLLVSTVFSASIVSVIKNGRVMEGIKSIPVYAVVAIAIYYVATALLGSLFSGIIA